MAQTKPQNKVLTGNRLRDGETVYYTAAGTWSPFVSEAVIETAAEGIDALAKIGAAAQAANIVIDVNVIDVTPGAGVTPAHIREVIRATGPTVRSDLHKPVAPPQR